MDASIVIVCMNNMRNLLPCLNSIKEHTHKVNYDIWVVAYLFSKENLEILRQEYPDAHVIESNEIRGFSENNNLALRQISAKYTLVLNDDTLFKEPVLDKLFESIESTPNAAIMSPKLLYGDGSLQLCGVPPRDVWYYVRLVIGFNKESDKENEFANKKGIFKTYNICGACFLIKTDVFRELGFFDEYYFFCPEDIAFSTLANEKGYSVYTNADVSLYHLQGKTSSKVKPATLPAERKGCIKFFSKGNLLLYYLLATYVFLLCAFKCLCYTIKLNEIDRVANRNCMASIFSSKTPKEIFTKYYLKLNTKR